MPSKSEKQHKYWLWVLYGKKNATEKEKSVAKEFLDKDKETGKHKPNLMNRNRNK